jgi:branched-chain amino acid transport system permease protein
MTALEPSSVAYLRGGAGTAVPIGTAPSLTAMAWWAVPLAALLLAVPYLLSPYQVMLLSYGFVMGIAALGFNLLLGYTGLLSFGHAAFFGAGGYAVAMTAKFFGVTSLEIFLLVGIAVSGVLALLLGVICVRHTKIFFSILALALSQVLWSVVLKFFWVTGGTDGLRVPAPTILGGRVGDASDALTFMTYTYYYAVILVFAMSVVVMWMIVNSPFGKALQAIRDNETRAEFVGVSVRSYRLRAFVVSGIFTGLAGSLWAPLNGHTTPELLYWTFSGEIVFVTVLGGFRHFSGPIVGGLVFTYLKSYAVGYTVYWQLLLGAVLVGLVLALPSGLVGGTRWLVARLRGLAG